jgi:phosphoglycerate dehydrogenase-like enzyme
VAARARAFAARVIYFDVAPAGAETERALEANPVTLGELLAQSDILSLHLPLTAQTRHCVGAPALAQMKSTAILINTARGPLVEEAALVQALRAGRLAGAGLDVFESEPLPAGHPLLALPNVVLTPHIAAGTVDALVAKLDACFANMQRVIQGEAPHDVVTH